MDPFQPLREYAIQHNAEAEVRARHAEQPPVVGPLTEHGTRVEVRFLREDRDQLASDLYVRASHLTRDQLHKAHEALDIIEKEDQ